MVVEKQRKRFWGNQQPVKRGSPVTARGEGIETLNQERKGKNFRKVTLDPFMTKKNNNESRDLKLHVKGGSHRRISRVVGKSLPQRVKLYA